MRLAGRDRAGNVPYVPYVPSERPESAGNWQATWYIGHIGHILRGRCGGKKAMDYDVGDMLDSLFGAAVPTVIVTVAPAAAAGAVKPLTPTVEPNGVDVQDVPDFDSLPLPGDPCPRCGSLEEWADLLGRHRCGVCERDILAKALSWAGRAAKLRERAQRQRPAPRLAPGCVAAGRVDILDVGSNRPMVSIPGAL
jgi:hypothetical protein